MASGRVHERIRAWCGGIFTIVLTGSGRRAVLGCVLPLVFATGIAACGDGVLQTSEVERSLADAGYPRVRVATYAEVAARFPGARIRLEDLFGDLENATDVVSSGTIGTGEVLVVAAVLVDIDSGRGVQLDDARPETSTYSGKAVRSFLGESSVVPAWLDLRRIRVASLCNVELTAYEATPDPDDRFDRAVGYLEARC